MKKVCRFMNLLFLVAITRLKSIKCFYQRINRKRECYTDITFKHIFNMFETIVCYQLINAKLYMSSNQLFV